MAEEREAARKSEAEARRASAKAKDAQLKESREAADADTKAHYKRIAASRPTPTQEENDRAKLGFDSLEELDDKEDDGSGSEADARIAAAEATIEREKAAAKAAEPKK